MKTSETRKVEAYSLSIFRILQFMLRRYFINPLRYLDLTLGLCIMAQICTRFLFCHLSLNLSQKKLFVDSGCMYTYSMYYYIIYYVYTLSSIPYLPICTSQQLLKTNPFLFTKMPVNLFKNSRFSSMDVRLFTCELDGRNPVHNHLDLV